MNYKYGNKNNWRRWYWNKIRERVNNPRDAIVLYLAGEADLDRDVALAKGFKNKNLIAVENRRSVLAALRAKCVLTIDSDLCDVITDWPLDKPVQVVVGDFCGGLTLSRLKKLKHCWLRPQFHDAVFCFNFLRGRDSTSNEIRKVYSEGARKMGLGCQKHRAEAFMAFLARGIAYLCEKAAPIDKHYTWDELTNFSLYCLDKSKPEFRSYRSTAGNQIFDSVVFKSPFKEIPIMSSVSDVAKGSTVRRRIAATMAHRTMRL
jgi:hypothetical protein